MEYRFIPTLVGNTIVPSIGRRNLAVHPHARGEHELAPVPVAAATGSSPRSWGTRIRESEGEASFRFIPTLVGNTASLMVSVGIPAVHPHARGEHSGYQEFARIDFGSSPRSWGTPFDEIVANTVTRFIPTLVGNTSEPCCWQSALTVHPHARGEHPSPSVQTNHCVGSSPRSWGTHSSQCANGILVRFIPTLVGNTSSTRKGVLGIAVHPHARGEHTKCKPLIYKA